MQIKELSSHRTKCGRVIKISPDSREELVAVKDVLRAAGYTIDERYYGG